MHVRLPKGSSYYQAFLRVPEDVRHLVGKTQFKKSLKTSDKREAQRLAAQIVPLWEQEIAKARQTPESIIASKLEEHRRLIEEINKQIARARTDNEWDQLQETKGVLEIEVANLITSSLGFNDASELYGNDLTAAQLAYKITTGQFVPFCKHLEEFLRVSRVNLKTADEKRRWICRFDEYVGDCYVQMIKRSLVRSFANDLVDKDKLSHVTAKKALSHLAGYWDFLRDHKGVANEDLPNPFKEIRLPKINKKEEQSSKRLPFSVDDIHRIYDHLTRLTAGNRVKAQDKAMRDTFLLGIYTGGRIEELVRLTADKVNLDKETLSITDAKTSAGNREVPIHPELLPVIRRLLSEAHSDHREYLIATDSKNKFGNRSDPLSKRFGRLKTELGYDGRYVFHSLRKTVVTLLEQAGVPEGITADIVGHEKDTMTYGLYSGGTSLTQKREALKSLNYGLRL
ncbi:tyrosine-type recombinase/integrase [Roseovarius sp. 10]|uniref:tyrosine-type recombinase/integrase n=1 Tax=Roseovarius sp. 10 TaxID=3080563 RepID=UPI0029543C92|nr:tyrosine-type recombinase/integrase [Roseovarius sp. 10]MDV7201490.1 tyrosine-type recombinase/integrase [Roseovarius sp. 10]